MSFVDNEDDPSQNPNDNLSQADVAAQGGAQAQKQPEDNPPDPSTSMGGGTGVVTGNPGGGAIGNAAQAKPSSSGSWTNLNSYLEANSDQAGKVGSDIAGNINSQGSQAQNEISDLGSKFNNQVQQNTVNYDPNAVSGALNQATALKAGQNLDPNAVQTFRKQATASYNGPTDVTKYDGYSQAANDANNTMTNAGLTTSEAGRDQLLKNQYQKASQNGYTQGENNLDQLLLENNPNARASLEPLANQWSGLNGALQGTVTSGNTAAQNALKATQQTATQTNAALTDANAKFQNQITTGLANLQAQNTAAYNKVHDDLASGNVTPEDYAAIGINPADHDYLQVNKVQYLNQNAQPTLGNYATADNYAQAQALAQLAGQKDSSFLSQNNIKDAGMGLNNQPFSYDKNSYLQAQHLRELGYQQEQQALYDKYSHQTIHPYAGATEEVVFPDYGTAKAYYGQSANDPTTPWGQIYAQMDALDKSYGYT